MATRNKRVFLMKMDYKVVLAALEAFSDAKVDAAVLSIKLQLIELQQSRVMHNTM